jgi:hypothetical protein
LEVSGQLHTPANLSSRKSIKYPLYRRLDGHQGRSGQCGEKEILGPTGIRTPTPWSSSPIASRYTDCAIPAPIFTSMFTLFYTMKWSSFSQNSNTWKSLDRDTKFFTIATFVMFHVSYVYKLYSFYILRFHLEWSIVSNIKPECNEVHKLYFYNAIILYFIIKWP